MSDTSAFGYGQMEPSDTASEYNVICFIVTQLMAKMQTMIPVQVQAVYVQAPGGVGPAGTVDVLPLVTQLDGQNNATPHGTVHGLPFFRVGAGSNAIICDPQVGDIGIVHAASRDISSVVSKRGQANPGSLRKYDLADGVYVGGILGQTPTQYVVFTPTGINIGDKNGNIIEMAAGFVNIVTTVLKVNGVPVTVP